MIVVESTGIAQIGQDAAADGDVAMARRTEWLEERFPFVDGGGSGSSSNGGNSGQITVWTWPDNDKTFAKTVPIFQQKFPGIKVNVQAFANTSGVWNPLPDTNQG